MRKMHFKLEQNQLFIYSIINIIDQYFTQYQSYFW